MINLPVMSTNIVGWSYFWCVRNT